MKTLNPTSVQIPTIFHVIYVPFAVTDGTDMEDSCEYVADIQEDKL